MNKNNHLMYVLYDLVVRRVLEGASVDLENLVADFQGVRAVRWRSCGKAGKFYLRWGALVAQQA